MHGSAPKRWLVLGCSFVALSMMGIPCSTGPKPKITITSPAHGLFTTAPTVTITGTIANFTVDMAQVTVNGSVATLNPDSTWSITLPVDNTKIMNPYLAVLNRIGAGPLARARILVHYGSSIADGTLSPESVALRLTDAGLDQVEPIIQSGVALDPGTLLPDGTLVINDY
jgi:hypothetical protein